MKEFLANCSEKGLNVVRKWTICGNVVPKIKEKEIR